MKNTSTFNALKKPFINTKTLPFCISSKHSTHAYMFIDNIFYFLTYLFFIYIHVYASFTHSHYIHNFKMRCKFLTVMSKYMMYVVIKRQTSFFNCLFQNLISYMEKNPQVYKKILKKKMKEEKENEGPFSFLKVMIWIHVAARALFQR